MRGYGIVVGALALAACEIRVVEQPELDRGSGPPGLSATSDKQRYAPGDVVKLTIENDTDNEFWFNVCWDQMERRQGGSWLPVESDRVCIAIAHHLPGRETVNAAYPLEEDVADGTYRIVVKLSETVLVRSNAFRVER